MLLTTSNYPPTGLLPNPLHHLFEPAIALIEEYLWPGAADQLRDAGLTGLDSRDAAQRFANVIDILCARDLRLTLVGDRPLSELVPTGRALDFTGTASGLSLL